LKGHTKKINHVALREMQGENTLILSASADKIAKVWAHDTSGEYIPKFTVCTHEGELIGLAVHPTNSIFTLLCRQNVLVHDFTTFDQIFQLEPSNATFASLAIHPDEHYLP
jgi:pre-mRNA-processing factor 19